MKKTILNLGIATLFIVGSTTFIACGTTENQGTGTHEQTENHSHEEDGTHEHSDNGEKHKNTVAFEGEKAQDLALILESYFQLKNALVVDDSEIAAEAAEKVLSNFNGFDKTSLSKEKVQEYIEIEDDAIENVEHILKNVDKIDHQREHFVNLSEDINDLIVLVGTTQHLYQDFCPMANDGNGATWISEVEEIQNPYMGSKMPTCGKIQNEIK